MSSETSYRGFLLVAAPSLLDPNFNRTVVLIVEHGDQGTLGLVLNRPSETTVKELWDQIGNEPCSSERPLFMGGPVEGPLMALHSHETLGDNRVLEGVFFSVQKENLTELVRQPDDSYRLYVGHAGWSPGQLESEIQEGSWLIAPAKLEFVLHSGDDLWERLREQIAKSSFLGQLGVKHCPPNPRMN
jgi:putative transcriptional regulator